MNLIKKYHIKAKKALWQNFLVDEEILINIASTLDLFGKNIVEVWPGYWALTEKILENKPKNLDLIELDTKMVQILEERIQKSDLPTETTNIVLKNIDVLTYIPKFEEYLVVANIPYYITSPILRHFFYNVDKIPEKMLILMQKDVGDKILQGKTESKKIKNSVLSLFLQKKSHINEVLFVEKKCFLPSPKVDSTVLLFEKHNLYNEVDDNIFLKFIKIAFAEPRKKLWKNLAKVYKKGDIIKIFSENNIDENTRPEQIDIAWYCNLTMLFNNISTEE